MIYNLSISIIINPHGSVTLHCHCALQGAGWNAGRDVAWRKKWDLEILWVWEPPHWSWLIIAVLKSPENGGLLHFQILVHPNVESRFFFFFRVEGICYRINCISGNSRWTSHLSQRPVNDQLQTRTLGKLERSPGNGEANWPVVWEKWGVAICR